MVKHTLESITRIVALATDANPRSRLEFASLTTSETKALLGFLRELAALRKEEA